MKKHIIGALVVLLLPAVCLAAGEAVRARQAGEAQLMAVRIHADGLDEIAGADVVRHRDLYAEAGYRLLPLEPPAESSDDRRAGLPVLHYDESGRQRKGISVCQVQSQNGQGK